MSYIRDRKAGKYISSIIYPTFFWINKEDTVLNLGCGNCVQIQRWQFKEMVGIDINPKRLEEASKLKQYNLSFILANIESVPIRDRKFDKIIAIDSIEHTINPEKVISEMKRLLKDNGQLMITFPSSHDKWEYLFRLAGKLIGHKRTKVAFPDSHQYSFTLKHWKSLMEKGGFTLVKSKATTLFPPLHYLGIPKFWFTNRYVHYIDNQLCQLPILKNLGQALVCVYKIKLDN